MYNLSSASKALPIKCLPQSFYRRMQRFFAGQYFDYRQISQLIFNMFSFDQVQLTLDRTNWKWGKRNINILMLAIVYRGIGYLSFGHCLINVEIQIRKSVLL